MQTEGGGFGPLPPVSSYGGAAMDIGACTEPSFTTKLYDLARAVLPFLVLYGGYKLYRGFSDRFLNKQ